MTSADARPPSVALVHDYLTQRGGAERVVVSMLKAFPCAPLHTSFYEPERTFPEFRSADVRPLPIARAPLLGRHHRLALPLLATAFSRLELDADAVVCSSSGWAHGARVSGSKIVYCHAPARWLYQPDRYLGRRRPLARAALAALRPALARWDRRAAAGADTYLANSRAVRDLIRSLYGIEAEVLHPPSGLDASGPQQRVTRLEPGFFLCVARLLPYKNVDSIVTAFESLPGEQLAVVGVGPDSRRLRSLAPANVRFLGEVSAEELRWLYASCTGVVAAAYEDFGLTPVEAASFGKPSAALRFGGFLDTIVEDVTGLLFEEPSPTEVRDAVRKLGSKRWDPATLVAHADRFSESAFVSRLRMVVAAAARG